MNHKHKWQFVEKRFKLVKERPPMDWPIQFEGDGYDVYKFVCECGAVKTVKGKALERLSK